jgi:type III pantothenate kinase
LSPPPGANPRFSLLDLGNRHAKFGLPDGSCGQRVQLDSAQPDASVAAFAAVCAAHAPLGPLLVASVAPRWWERLEPELRRAGAIVRSLTTADVPLCVLSQGTGVDRLLAAWWAQRAATGPAVVASFGTAFTVDAVDGAGAFHGGAIGAGLGLQIAALAGAAPHLPPPDPHWQPQAIPRTSADAIAAGTRQALALAVNALAENYARRLNAPGCARFCTGGDAELLAPLLGPAWRLEPDLVLRALADLNRP